MKYSFEIHRWFSHSSLHSWGISPRFMTPFRVGFGPCHQHERQAIRSGSHPKPRPTLGPSSTLIQTRHDTRQPVPLGGITLAYFTIFCELKNQGNQGPISVTIECDVHFLILHLEFSCHGESRFGLEGSCFLKSLPLTLQLVPEFDGQDPDGQEQEETSWAVNNWRLPGPHSTKMRSLFVPQ